MFKSISEDQFRLAQDTLYKIRALLGFRDRLIEQGNLKAELVLPSPMWKAITLFKYFLNPTYDIVNTLRLHTFPFTGHYLGHSINNPPPDSFIKRYRKFTAGLPSDMIARPPQILGEIGWEVDGNLINKDILMYQRHITALYLAGVFDYFRSKQPIRILEIGPGYGGLAYFLWKILKPSAFYLLDLTEALAFSSVYITIVGDIEGVSSIVYDRSNPELLNAPKNGFVFLPNFLIKDLCNTDKFDFVVNTGSFGEMTETQVDQYADIINDQLAEDGIMFEENGEIVPVSDILSKRFKCKKFYKDKRLWAKDEATLAKATASPKELPCVRGKVSSRFTNTFKHIQKMVIGKS